GRDIAIHPHFRSRSVVGGKTPRECRYSREGPGRPGGGSGTGPERSKERAQVPSEATNTAGRPTLTLVAPRRAKPARHLADLTMEERRAAVAELGEKPFRADQLSRHYF